MSQVDKPVRSGQSSYLVELGVRLHALFVKDVRDDGRARLPVVELLPKVLPDVTARWAARKEHEDEGQRQRGATAEHLGVRSATYCERS